MDGRTLLLRSCLLGAAPVLAATNCSPAWAEDAGRRDFPATLVVEEPQVETEIAPQVAAFAQGGARRTDVSSDLSLKVAKSVSVIINPDYTLLRPGGGGFQALEVGLKAQFVANAEHELVLSAGLLSTLGGTGSARVDADATTTLIPTLYYGKGGGDLPDALAWARPFALTGQLGIVLPTRPRPPGSGSGSLAGDGQDETNPTLLAVAGSLQYSLPYASETVLSGDAATSPLPKALAALVPLVEYEIAVPVANGGAHARTVGTINPGVLYVDAARNVTWGLEALLPINRASGSHPGARLQLSYSFQTPWPLAGKAPD